VLHGDLGQSFWQRRPVIAALGDAMPNTLVLAGTALLIDFTLGLALGVYQAARARRFGDIALGNAALFVNSMRTFWLGLVLLLVLALRNALLPSITLFGLAFPFLVTGAVLVEWVFAWPGMGWLAVMAIGQRDYPVVTATALVASGMVTVGNLLADVVYAAADPRIRVRGA